MTPPLIPLLLAAAGAFASTASGAAFAAAAAGPAAAFAAPPAADAGTLRRGNGPEPSTLDAHRCPEVACQNILRDLYEGLVAEDAAGAIIPGMAEAWSSSPDGLAWTFRLRAGLAWSDGRPLDAPQWVASLRRALAPATAGPFASQFEAIAGARAVLRGEAPPEALGVEAPDARTVVIRLERPAPLLALLTLPTAFPVDLAGVEAHGAQHTRPGRLASNGAYRLADWQPQSHLVLERNPAFHAPAPIARVRYVVTEDAAAELLRYQAGGLDITETLPPQPLARLRARFGEQLRIAPYLGAFWLGFNLERPPFRGGARGTPEAGRALREALSLAVDRDILVRHVTGFGEQAAYGVVPPGASGHAPARLPWADWPQAGREARARALYAEAGYSADAPLEVELRYNTSTPHRRMALAVASMWREVLGVRVRLRNEEWKVFVHHRGQRAITQVFRGGWIADLDDARGILLPFAGDTALNWTGFRDPAFDALLDGGARAADAAAAREALHAAEARLLEAHAVVPLYFYASKHLVSPRVLGWQDHPLDRHPSRWLRLADAPAEAEAAGSAR